MRTGVMFRANRLLPDQQDLEILHGLGLTAVHDLRDVHEIKRHPDHAIHGATWRHHEVASAPRLVVNSLTTPDETVMMMIELYQGFVTNPDQRAGFGSLLRTLAATPGPQVFHCAAGKDRTGWAAWLLHQIVGLSPDDALADYLLTDQFASGSRTATLESIGVRHGADRAPILEPAYRCDVRYLEAAVGSVGQTFGTVHTYLAQGLGLSHRDLRLLRSKLTAP